LKGINCLVYEERPKQCALFPLISVQRTKTGNEHHPFCKGLLPGKEFEVDKKEVLGHYEKVRSHLNEVKEKGFEKIWQAIPEKGILMLSNEFIDELKKGEFIGFIEE
jgi:Fe-S-cluster containining protein